MGIDLEQAQKGVQENWERNKRNKEEKENKKQSYYTPEDKIPVIIDKDIVVRVIDNPVRAHFSFIKNDKDEISFIKFPDFEENPDWILHKICTRVLKKTWKGKNPTTKKSIWEYDYEKTHPESFYIVYNNGYKEIKGGYGAQGWVKDGYRPDRGSYIQCINRQPFVVTEKDKDGNPVVKQYGADWCEVNKKSLLLVKDTRGSTIPITVHDLLVDHLFPDYGSFLNYDVAVKRLKDKPWYTVRNVDKLEAVNPENAAIIAMSKKGPLDPDFLKSLETYNLRSMAAPSKYKYIYDNLKGKIAIIDRDFQTSYLTELERLVELEEKGNKKVTRGSASSQSPEPSPEAVNPVQTPKVPDTASTASPAQAQESALGTPDLAAKVSKVAPHFSSRPENSVEKYVKDVVNGVLIWKDVHVASLLPCPECGKEQPTALDKACVFCGVEFKDEPI